VNGRTTTTTTTTMSDQPELKEFPEFPGEPMSKRYDTTRIANAIPSIHPSIGGALDAFFNRNRHRHLLDDEVWFGCVDGCDDSDDGYGRRRMSD
jgi:hypothetical protein